MKYIFTAVAALAFSVNAAQAAEVKCAAAGVWSGGTAYLIVKKLDAVNGTADIEGINAAGVPWKGSPWKYKDGVLTYESTKSRYVLRVGEQSLDGSYTSFQSTGLSRPHLSYQCGAPIKNVLVGRQP